MKPYILNLVNTVSLIALSLFGYFISETPSVTALIPFFFGVLLIALTPSLKKEKKIASHIVVVLTVLVLIGLIKPLTGAIDRSDSGAILRVAIMILTSVLALISFIKSFIAARSNKTEE